MYVIAGPCSAESPEQILETAGALHEIGIDVFRAGVWKPRTHPGCFEGYGAKALPWLNQVQERFGMKVCCEVAGAKHVEQCLEAGIDMLWIGARTTSNPFLVQEIADALSGTEVPVLVKNPINPDLGLWIGAFERLSGRGISNLSAIHRGVSSRRQEKYRNDPAWDMAIEFRSSFPEIPLYCDPSHMGGAVRYVHELSQKALDMGFDGLMIETHCCPERALSDAAQQLTPAQLDDLLNGDGRLTVRENDSEDESYRRKIAILREKIDAIDENLVSLLADRMEVSRQIGAIKRDNNIAIIQPARWDEVVSGMTKEGRSFGLHEDFVRSVFAQIHKESISVQDNLSKENLD